MKSLKQTAQVPKQHCPYIRGNVEIILTTITHRWDEVDWNREIKHGKGWKKSVGKRKRGGDSENSGSLEE